MDQKSPAKVFIKSGNHYYFCYGNHDPTNVAITSNATACLSY